MGLSSVEVIYTLKSFKSCCRSWRFVGHSHENVRANEAIVLGRQRADLTLRSPRGDRWNSEWNSSL